MRIAFLADSLDRQYGGIHIYTKEILNAISKVDKKNEYVIIRAESKNEFQGMEELVVPYSTFSGYRAWRLFVELPKLIQKKNIDLVLEPAHFGPFNLPEKIKRITVIHDLTILLFPQHHVFHSQFLQKKFLPHILKKANHIITNSKNTSKDLHHFFPFTKKKTTSILLGKNELFQPKKDASILSNLKITQPYILYVGTLEPRKNVTTLIQAFNDFKSKTGLPHQLVLVGKKGWKSDAIINSINNSSFKNNIILTGYVPEKDLPFIYSLAELFVYPSLYEGFGFPILEAMACGVPVITSNISSLPEVGGKAVQYVTPNNSEQLSQKIIEIISSQSKRQKMVELGFQQAEKFSWEKTALETIKVFENC